MTKTAKKRLGILISGGGSNLQAIIDACEKGVLRDIAEVAVVISNRADAYGLVRAKNHGIPGIYLDRKQFKDSETFNQRLVEDLKKHKVELVCLAGYLLKLEPCFVKAFHGKILNIHPALLPKYGGKGMYGHHVHKAVVEAKEIESGATVHFVDEEYDHGKTIVQAKVPVYPEDTPDLVAKRVLTVEHKIYVQAIKKIIEARSELGGQS